MASRAALPALPALLAPLLWAAAALAQAAPVENGTRFRDWTLACRATGIGATACVLNQVLVTAEDNAFLAEMGVSMQATEDGPRAVLVMRVPTGVLLLRRPAVRIDGRDEAPIPLSWQSCDERVCAASAVLDADQTGLLRRGVSGVVGYQRLDAGEPTIFGISLLGITAGMETLQEALPG